MNSKDKGKRGERMAAAKFREHGFDARRGVQYSGGPDSPDVVGPEGLHIEVKFTERLRLWDALAQSKRDDLLIAQKNVDAIIFVSKNPAPAVPYLKEIAAMGNGK